jgi:hypothetical protein
MEVHGRTLLHICNYSGRCGFLFGISFALFIYADRNSEQTVPLRVARLRESRPVVLCLPALRSVPCADAFLGPLRRMALPDPQSPHPFSRPTPRFRGTTCPMRFQARGMQSSSSPSPCNGNRTRPDPCGLRCLGGSHTPISRHSLRGRHIPFPASKS